MRTTECTEKYSDVAAPTGPFLPWSLLRQMVLKPQPPSLEAHLNGCSTSLSACFQKLTVQKWRLSGLRLCRDWAVAKDGPWWEAGTEWTGHGWSWTPKSSCLSLRHDLVILTRPALGCSQYVLTAQLFHDDFGVKFSWGAEEAPLGALPYCQCILFNSEQGYACVRAQIPACAIKINGCTVVPKNSDLQVTFKVETVWTVRKLSLKGTAAGGLWDSINRLSPALCYQSNHLTQVPPQIQQAYSRIS